MSLEAAFSGKGLYWLWRGRFPLCWLYGSGVEKLSGYGEACSFMVNIGLTGRLCALDFLKFVFCLQLMAASSKGVRYAVVCAADKNR